jgi:CheY-like chemotaxis protein
VTKVLILDDERFDRHRLARFCSGLDFECEFATAKTLGDFDTLIAVNSFDLIFIDYRLPDGTGIEALHMVHMSAQNNNAATIMITGQAQAEIAQEAIDKGCQDYLSNGDLCTPSFARTVQNAIQKTTPRASHTSGNAQSYPRADVEAILEHFASQCVQDMKPMVSRMMRLARNLRAQSGEELGATPAITAIEGSCANLWEHLVALERSSGDGMITETLASRSSHQYQKFAKPGQKPPSPFSKVLN